MELLHRKKPWSPTKNINIASFCSLKIMLILPLVRDHLTFKTTLRGGLFKRVPLTVVGIIIRTSADLRSQWSPHHQQISMQERRNSSALAVELRLSCINPSIYCWFLPLLLMPWLLASPEHRQPWYWLCRIIRSLSYMRKDFNYLHHHSLEKW